MVWRVVATQQGQYNNCIMDIGMVFDLLLHEDGSYPPALNHKPRKDDKGVVVPDEWISTAIIGKDNKPVHRDFAEDMGNRVIKQGPRKGEVMRTGWMKRVPDSTPLGLYPVDGDGNIQCDFWAKNVQLPQAFDVGYHPWQPSTMDRKRNHAPIRQHLVREEEEAA